MNKRILVVFGVALVGALAILAINIFKQQKHHDFKVAIFYPATHPAMAEMIKGIKDTVAQKSNAAYQFEQFNANGNKTLLLAQADEIARTNYDAVITLGACCSQTIFERSKSKDNISPLIFTGFSNPAELGIIASEQSSGNHVTGSTIKNRPQQTFATLFSVKPSTKTVLFVYDPAHDQKMVQIEQEIRHEVEKNGAKLKSVQVFQSNEIHQKVSGQMDGVDVVYVYTDHTVVAGIDSLVTLCNRHGATLFCSATSMAEKGAALCYGFSEYDSGVEAAHKLLAVVEEKQHPSNVPVTPVRKQTLIVNTKTAKAQGLVIPQKQLALIKKSGGIVL